MKNFIITMGILFGSLLLLALIVIFAGNISATDTTDDTTDDTTQTTAKTFDEMHKDTNPVATIQLAQGDKVGTMTFELYPDVAPESVNNFIALANSGFYNGLTMHRLVADFVVQGGDPEGTGTGGPGYSIKGEFPSNGVDTGLTHQKGALAWARSSAADSAGSQFYVVLGDEVSYLDEDYAVFGYMIDGQEVLDYLNKVETDANDKPVEEITIQSVLVDTKGVEYDAPEKL